ncbi:hypothetical protein RI509_05180 [Levilactobacillus namurensis]|uniref:Transposase n=1 Tax=Levilactobacillus namurensis TaxID=380393 RepID=A0AAW8W8D3_9LACO|nr:hypothetical protein [Levilactobacillus namurensis]MDT7014481.1 hypothetical protein [Levilactobacillus namurensis]MDT7018587.1 hypothetical protein [Levilactobacillus namurensis]
MPEANALFLKWPYDFNDHLGKWFDNLDVLMELKSTADNRKQVLVSSAFLIVALFMFGRSEPCE